MIDCSLASIIQVRSRRARAGGCPRLSPVTGAAHSPARIAPISPRWLSSTAPSRAQPSRTALPRARARVPRPRPVLAAHLVPISCRRAWSVPLFLLQILLITCMGVGGGGGGMGGVVTMELGVELGMELQRWSVRTVVVFDVPQR